MGVGQYGFGEARSWGLSGIMSRCTGLKKDVRFHKNTTYGSYFFINGKSYVGRNGDSLDRYLLRVQEMSESSALVVKGLAQLSTKSTEMDQQSSWFAYRQNYLLKGRSGRMETTIKHFKGWSEGLSPTKNISSQFVESPKGEFGVTLLSDGTNKPYRCKIKSPALNHIQFLPKLTKNVFLADLITLIGTVDIVFGEIDR